MSSTTTYPFQSSLRSSQFYNDEPSSPIDIHSYTRTMREHTAKQMEAATLSARRRSADTNGNNAHASLNTHGSISSVDSRGSARSWRTSGNNTEDDGGCSWQPGDRSDSHESVHTYTYIHTYMGRSLVGIYKKRLGILERFMTRLGVQVLCVAFRRFIVPFFGLFLTDQQYHARSMWDYIMTCNIFACFHTIIFS